MNCPVLPKNEGTVDRIIRLVVGSLLLVAANFLLTGTVKSVANVFGILAIVTGAIGFCGLYTILGISTRSKTKK